VSYTAQAEHLADIEDLGEEVADIAGRSLATGLDAEVTRGILVATVILEKRPNRRPAWADDAEMVSAIDDLNLGLWGRITAIKRLRAEVEPALEQARADLEAARRALAGAKDEQARAAAHARMRQAAAVIADCEAALEILEDVERRLLVAASKFLAPGDDLADVYEAAYDTVARGHRLPFDGRWLGNTA
jgi:hypothetical protein